MAQPPAGYTLQDGAYFTPKGAGPVAWDGTSMTPAVSDTAPPAGYTFQAGGYFTTDGQGPYRWDGTSMTLI